MYLGDRSVLSSQQDRCTVLLWDHKELLHSRRSDGSFHHSSMIRRLATHNKLKHFKNENSHSVTHTQRQNTRQGCATLQKWLQEKILNQFLHLPISSAVVTELQAAQSKNCG